MQKSILGQGAKQKAIAGMKYLVSATKQTLGPWGSNCLIEKGVRITNDGFTVSREILPSIKDEFERMGAKIIHEASSKTNDQVGDATTTAEVLAEAIVLEATKNSGLGGKRPSEIIEQIKKEKEEVLEKLKTQVKEIKTEEELINSAKVSVENDELADIIGKAQWKIGQEGVIIAEETEEFSSSIEYVKGIRIDNGLGATQLMNNQEKQSLEVDNCAVILTNYVLQGSELAEGGSLSKITTNLVNLGKKKIVIIARGFSSECIRMCLETCVAGAKNGVALIPINAPFTNQREIMKDLEAVLGGRYIDTEEGKLEDIGILEVGFATKIIAKRFTAIIAGSDDKITQERVEARVKVLKEGVKGATAFEKKNLQARISQLQNGFAILKVGAETDVERKRKKDKCDDAVQAVRLAYQGGTVRGGGLAFKEIAEGMPDDSILKRPLLSVYEQIMSSAPEGFKIPEWVADPYLVLKSALENACSVAGTFATVNAIVTSSNPHQCKCQQATNEEEAELT